MFSFSNVEVSPVISPPLAIFLNNLRIIFPDLVLGNASEKEILSGLAIEPIFFLTHSLKSSENSELL